MELNEKQQKVKRALGAKPKTIRDLARKCFPGVRQVEKADSQVRNQLRALVAAGFARQTDRGTYEAA